MHDGGLISSHYFILQTILTDARERFVESVSSSEYPRFLNSMIPALETLVKQVPVTLSDTPEHKVRRALLELLERLPTNDFLKPFAIRVVQIAMEMFQNVSGSNNNDDGCGSFL